MSLKPFCFSGPCICYVWKILIIMGKHRVVVSGLHGPYEFKHLADYSTVIEPACTLTLFRALGEELNSLQSNLQHIRMSNFYFDSYKK